MVLDNATVHDPDNYARCKSTFEVTNKQKKPLHINEVAFSYNSEL